jgi:WhiB family redox-sensing transcriptional regulator
LKWCEKAGCVDQNPELFFPAGAADDVKKQEKRALSVCSNCTVRLCCLKYSITTHQDIGIWGGRTEKDRRLAVKNWQKETGQSKQSVQFTGDFFDRIDEYI